MLRAIIEAAPTNTLMIDKPHLESWIEVSIEKGATFCQERVTKAPKGVSRGMTDGTQK